MTHKVTKRLQNRVALITGSGRGLGAAIATRFAEEGASVCINDISLDLAQTTAHEIEKLGVKTLVSNHDISQHTQAKAMITEAVNKFGKLDILVNNAGILRDSLLHKMSEDKFDDVIRVNLKGVFNCTQAAAAVMVPQQGGRIINLSSIAAFGNVGQTNYSAAKAGVIGLTRTTALELARYNITVNAIAPGMFLTEMTKSVPKDIMDKFIQRIPLKRMGNPQEIAALAAYLASDEASYFTGQTLCLDGGLTVGIPTI